MLAHTCGRSTKSEFRLLYLGNDLKLIATVRRVFTEPDYRLVACSDREGAILFLKSDIPYDVLLIDLEWRETEGLKLARLAHSVRHRKRMPIILVAATELNSELEAGVESWGEDVCDEDARHGRVVRSDPRYGRGLKSIRRLHPAAESAQA